MQCLVRCELSPRNIEFSESDSTFSAVYSSPKKRRLAVSSRIQSGPLKITSGLRVGSWAISGSWARPRRAPTFLYYKNSWLGSRVRLADQIFHLLSDLRSRRSQNFQERRHGGIVGRLGPDNAQGNPSLLLGYVYFLAETMADAPKARYSMLISEKLFAFRASINSSIHMVSFR